MNRLFLLFICVFWADGLFAQQVDTSRRAMTTEEEKLYDIMMEYRAEYHLPAIPVSNNLNYVALMHARDLMTNPPKGRCNMHSWSENGPWGKCCYTDNHAKAQCMWDKPSELTSYRGYGYEIAFWSSNPLEMAEQALQGWKESASHNHVMINYGVWSSHPWKAIGIAIVGNYAVAWFGEEEDL